MANQKPEKTFRLGNVSCSVFANNKEGRVYRSVQLQRSYRDGQGQWQYTAGLNVSDLPTAIRLLEAAVTYAMPLELEQIETA